MHQDNNLNYFRKGEIHKEVDFPFSNCTTF
jgi:hypothetical protein